MPFVSERASFQDAERGAQGGGAQALQRSMPKADLVLVFPYKTSGLVRWGDQSAEVDMRNLYQPSPQEKHQMEQWQKTRQSVITAMSDSGLVLMLYYSRDRDEIFVKVAADEQHIRQVAEMKRWKLELKPQYLSAFAEYKNDYAGRRELNYSDRRICSHLYKAHTDGDKYPRPDAIFRATDRIQLLEYIITSSDHNCAGVDIGQLSHDGDINQFFPLHENRPLIDMDNDWFKCFVTGHHIDKVRDYFGERIAMYFLFMAHLNKWLLWACIGCLGFWGIENLRYWIPIIDSLTNYRRMPVAVGMGFWGMFFIHYWRRTAATHASKWGTLGLGAQLEPTRPEFIGVSRINPVTGRIDRYYPWSERIWKVIFSYIVLSVTLVVLLFVVLSLFGLRHYMHNSEIDIAIPYAPGKWLTVGAITGRIMFQWINAFMVEILNWVFTKIAKKMTERENHRAYTEYANHLLAKTVVFKFFNCYCSLYYIAFFKQHSHLFGMEMHCVDDDCLNDLGTQLAIFMVVRFVLMNFLELAWPSILMWWRNFREGRTFHTQGLFTNPLTVMPDLSSAERQSKKEAYDLYEDMDEILMLYGYTTLFVVACPWVPLLALASTVLECFLDQKKLVLLYRRPFPLPAANNEPWDSAFDVFGILAMLTNGAVVVFASHAFDHWTHHDKIMLFLAIEHLIVFSRIMIGVLFPTVPHTVKLLSMQQTVVVHRHLDLGGDEDDHEMRATAMRAHHTLPPPVYDRDDDDDDMWG